MVFPPLRYAGIVPRFVSQKNRKEGRIPAAFVEKYRWGSLCVAPWMTGGKKGGKQPFQPLSAMGGHSPS